MQPLAAFFIVQRRHNLAEFEKACWCSPSEVWKEAAKASGLLSDSLPFIRAAIRSIHPLCSPRSTPTWPFDVKPPTYEPIGLIPTCEPKARTDHELRSALSVFSMFADFLKSQFSCLVPVFSSLNSILEFFPATDFSENQMKKWKTMWIRWTGFHTLSWQFLLQKL